MLSLSGNAQESPKACFFPVAQLGECMWVFSTTEGGKSCFKSIKKLKQLDHCEAKWMFAAECSLVHTRKYKLNGLLCLVKKSEQYILRKGVHQVR